MPRITNSKNGSTAYDHLKTALPKRPAVWLVTGVAGFIGSNLLQELLNLDQLVIGLDNYSTGSRANLEQVRELVCADKWDRFLELEGDVRDLNACVRAGRGVDYVLHQAALGSVPRSLANPSDSHASNVSGFLNMLLASRDNKVKRFVYASSSSVYGDHPALPKTEDNIGRCLSPYAATKVTNELYAGVFARCYGLQTVGLRYFNVFGPRQDPNGSYAAVIPRWTAAMIQNKPVHINGDGETSRDFCFVANVVQANLLAATVETPEAVNQVYNVALCARTSLNQLFGLLRSHLLPSCRHLRACRPIYQDFREGDVRHSEADISKARTLLGYEPTHTVEQGLRETLQWYRKNLRWHQNSVQSRRSRARRIVSLGVLPSPS
jgi:UDP-N-acetylglucosamine 4-epimerase